MIDAEKINDWWSGGENPSAAIWMTDFVDHPDLKVTADPDTPHFEIAGSLEHAFHQPVHENLTLAALFHMGDEGWTQTRGDTKFDGIAHPEIWYAGNQETIKWARRQFEYMRGVIWNDDPTCMMFNDKTDDNSSYGTGYDWYMQFKELDRNQGPIGLTQKLRYPSDEAWQNHVNHSLIRRSHFEDLQFLHSMACSKSELASETKHKIMIWLEVMYQVANREGKYDGGNIQIRDTPLAQLFTSDTEPKDTATLRDLLLGRTPS